MGLFEQKRRIFSSEEGQPCLESLTLTHRDGGTCPAMQQAEPA